MKIDKRRISDLYNIESKSLSNYKSELSFYGRNKRGKYIEFIIVMDWYMLKNLIRSHVRVLKDKTLESMGRDWNNLKDAVL